MPLSDFAIRQAKATGKPYTINDIDGLSLAVSAVGGKHWRFRYYWLGKQKRMSLGTYPEVTLREARALKDEARALVAKGINPHVHRKQKRFAARLAGENTFEAAFRSWQAHRTLAWCCCACVRVRTRRMTWRLTRSRRRRSRHRKSWAR